MKWRVRAMGILGWLILILNILSALLNAKTGRWAIVVVNIIAIPFCLYGIRKNYQSRNLISEIEEYERRIERMDHWIEKYKRGEL